MSTCTFFGHRDSPGELYVPLYAAVEKLILEEGVDRFLAGSQGHFDLLALRVLKDLQVKYPHIRFYEVLAYPPKNGPDPPYQYQYETVLPEGIETVPPRFAISRRNRWMAEQADYAVVHIEGPGGAAAATAYAEKRGCLLLPI